MSHAPRDTGAFRRKIVRRYDAFFGDPLFQAFVRHSGYANYGYWLESTRNGEAACDNLLERLLDGVPRLDGRVLDVACGQGGTTRALSKAFPGARITAVNISQSQLVAAAARVPGCSFALMDAAELGFASASFELVLCVEAAFHFESREAFLREAHRVLRPGGWLVFTDIVSGFGAGRIPRENLVGSVADYDVVLRRSGFEDVALADELRDTWTAFRSRYTAFLARHWIAALRRLPWLVYRGMLTDRAIKSYLLGRARKPPAGPSAAPGPSPAR